MEKFLFVLTRGLEDPTRVTRTFQLAKVAKESGSEVHIFLTDDAVFLAKPGMTDQINNFLFNSGCGQKMKNKVPCNTVMSEFSHHLNRFNFHETILI